MSGRKIRRGFILCLALLVVSSVALAAVSYPFYTKTTDSVRLRKGASTRTIALDTLPAGTPIEVIGKTGQFYKVRVDNQTGYILAEFVDTSEGAVSTPTPKKEETVTGYPYPSVTTKSLNLREQKNSKSTLLEKIPAGAPIVVRAVSGTWAEIEHEGTVGYALSSCISLKKVVAPKVTPTPTPAPSLSPEEQEAGYSILQRGSEGAEVKALQEALLELGFLKGTADGKFGAATENAVLLFQQANGYPTTGVMDANLQAFLYSGKPKNAKGEAGKVKTASPVEGASLKEGNVGDPVVRLQKALASLGYYDGEASGTFDTATKKAVKAFQKKNGLKDDGVAGLETLQLLYSDAALAVDQTPAPSPTPTPTAVPDFTIPSGKVKLNTEGDDAKLVQKRLKDLGYYKGRVDGRFGSASVKALKSFQETNGLAPDGVAGETTYQLLFSWGALAVGTTATPVPTAEATPEAPTVGYVVYTTLRAGMSGDAVKLLQEALINLGYLAGPSDGTYGRTTAAAVRAFQINNGLKTDGIAGSETQTLLFSGNGKKATATPSPTPVKTGTATPTPKASPTAETPLKKGSTGDAVKAMQTRLIALGYLTGKADGHFGTQTYEALIAFQKANRLSPDGILGAKTEKVLNSSSAIGKTGKALPTATPSKVPTVVTQTPTASRVIYANWYTTVKAVARKYPYATVYDYRTGISWQIHIFSLGAHADYEPLTATDTSKMLKVFGGNTWNPRAVWVVFADGSVYMASTHSMPHEVQHITDNRFEGHSCLHFPRTQEQVTAIGTYATSHQTTIDAGWASTQAMK